ncbi:hypothetical protein GCM10022223_46830 [Kineosporia mesophila]|uniref:Secreted protein n=1 Tax=Kineosporia mesophila TaxID=566012 RepID=A0ABP7A3U0_9ACTN|nr:hypothetical protein [Kineosporia mesophila]MCD5353794.1 hypothetical protein [Kineosporia mesophila]
MSARTSGERAAVAVLLLVSVGSITGAAVHRGGADESVPPADQWRVVQVHCENERIQHGVDRGRADGLLLAHDTGVAC